MKWTKRLAQMARRILPSYGRAQQLQLPAKTAGQLVTDETAMTVSAFWCCVRVLCEGVSQMDWRVHEVIDSNGSNRIARDHPADRLLYRAPNHEQDAAVWRELMMRWKVVWGNAYSEIVRDTAYRPVALWPIEPWRVTPFRHQGQLYYEVQQPTGNPEVLPAADVLHFRGMGDELEGWSVVQYMARCLGLAIGQEVSMASQMEKGARISGLLSPAGGGHLGDTKAKQLQKSWNAQNSGADKHGKVVMMSEGLDFQPMSMPNTDAQLLESREFSVIDICRFCRVPPHMVYDLTRATFSNIAHQSLEFIRDSLGPHVVKLEQQSNRKLISRARVHQFYSEMSPKALLRLDPETRVKYYKGLRDLGSISPNEIRRAEGMPDLGPDGDVFTCPVNLQTLEQLNAPKPDPVPTQTIGTPPIPPPDPDPEEVVDGEGEE